MSVSVSSFGLYFVMHRKIIPLIENVSHARARSRRTTQNHTLIHVHALRQLQRQMHESLLVLQVQRGRIVQIVQVVVAVRIVRFGFRRNGRIVGRCHRGRSHRRFAGARRMHAQIFRFGLLRQHRRTVDARMRSRALMLLHQHTVRMVEAHRLLLLLQH